MEAHFVHTFAAGGLAVVGVFIVPGKTNPVFNKIVSTMPAEEGSPVRANPGIDPISDLDGGTPGVDVFRGRWGGVQNSRYASKALLGPHLAASS